MLPKKQTKAFIRREFARAVGTPNESAMLSVSFFEKLVLPLFSVFKINFIGKPQWEPDVLQRAGPSEPPFPVLWFDNLSVKLGGANRATQCLGLTCI